MQNGGLAAVLAKTNFPLQPLVAVPAVFTNVIQTLFGGLLAAYWRYKTNKDEKSKEDQEKNPHELTLTTGMDKHEDSTIF